MMYFRRILLLGVAAAVSVTILSAQLAEAKYDCNNCEYRPGDPPCACLAKMDESGCWFYRCDCCVALTN